MADPTCVTCGHVLRDAAHACPPRWRVTVPAWGYSDVLHAADAAGAAAQAVEDLDDEHEALDEPVRVEVAPADGGPALAFDVRAEAVIDYMARPAGEVVQ